MSEGRQGHRWTARAGIGALVGTAALLLASPAAVAQGSTTTTSTTTTTEPPVQPADVTAFTKTFAPDGIQPGEVSTITFTITTDATDTGIAFTDNLPSGMTVDTAPPNAQCGGTVTAPAGSSTITFAGGAIDTTTCNITVDVTASDPGTYVNTTSDITWDPDGTAAGASGTLLVAPFFSKAFSPDTIDPGGTSTLTFTIDNTGNPDPVTFLEFDDTLPSDMTVSTDADSTQCDGTVTANAGDDTISFVNGTVAANDTCDIVVEVTASAPGTYDNTSSVLQSEELPDADAATASLVVTPLVVTKTFVEGSIVSGGTATFNVVIRNDGTEPLINIVVDDPLAPDCSRASGVLGTLNAGAEHTYTCTLANVTSSFTNELTVTAETDVSGITVSAVATAPVTVTTATTTPTTGATAAGQAIALTGSSTGPLTGIGLGIVALGSLMVFGASNRRWRLFRRT
jgi:uncharacterized repeat protein (TIGR01451 family)